MSGRAGFACNSCGPEEGRRPQNKTCSPHQHEHSPPVHASVQVLRRTRMYIMCTHACSQNAGKKGSHDHGHKAVGTGRAQADGSFSGGLPTCIGNPCTNALPENPTVNSSGRWTGSHLMRERRLQRADHGTVVPGQEHLESRVQQCESRSPACRVLNRPTPPSPAMLQAVPCLPASDLSGFLLGSVPSCTASPCPSISFPSSLQSTCSGSLAQRSSACVAVLRCYLW